MKPIKGYLLVNFRGKPITGYGFRAMCPVCGWSIFKKKSLAILDQRVNEQVIEVEIHEVKKKAPRKK